MPNKLFVFTARRGFLGLALMPFFAIQMSRTQMTAASQTGLSQKSLAAEMTSHQNEMKALSTKLDESFQAIADARDAKGYVHDKSIMKVHEDDYQGTTDCGPRAQTVPYQLRTPMRH